MGDEKNVNEVQDEIDSALKDPRGVLTHQKRLAFCLSAGIVSLLEGYLKKNNVLKHGVKLNHQWFKKKKENLKKILSSKVVSPLDKLNRLDKILDTAYNIESKRNELVYGKKASEKLLLNLIADYLQIKKEVEENGK